MDIRAKNKVSLKPSEAQFVQETCTSAATRPTEAEQVLGQRVYDARLAFAQRHNTAARGLARLDLSEARKDGLGWLKILDQSEVLTRTEQRHGHNPADDTERHCIDIEMSLEEKRGLLRRATYANVHALANGLNPQRQRDQVDDKAFERLQQATEEFQAEDLTAKAVPEIYNDPEMRTRALNSEYERARVTLSVTHGIMDALRADPSLRDN